ncbi:MAG TPA: squalene/phytoene synthase family protein [Steroidobacteraceae bacterium]|jgi:phytoene synthase
MSAKPEAHTPRFLAWLYSTRSQQPVLAALCGIEREVSASVRPGADHHVAHTRLEWWRAECARCVAGNPVHPLTRELRTHLELFAPASQANTALAGLSGLVDAATWDLAAATFERRAELTAYCRRWAAAMVAPAGAPGIDWSGFGAALCELELLGHVARDARVGRLRLPLEELEQAAISPEAVATPPWPRALTNILRARHQALRQQLAAAVAGFAPGAQQSSRGLLVWAALAWQASVRAERALPREAAASIASAAAANWRAWRAARAAAAGRLRLV